MYGKYGFPSNHSQAVAFWAVWIALHLFRYFVHVSDTQSSHRARSKPYSWPVRSLGAAGAIVAAGLVGGARIYLGYHSTWQVGGGLAIGAAAAFAWSFIQARLIEPLYPSISAHALARWLLVQVRVGAYSVGGPDIVQDVIGTPHWAQLEYDAISGRKRVESAKTTKNE